MVIAPGQEDRLPHGAAMVDGCFDPLHRGHVEYFHVARSLGVPVFCNLASDRYIATKKQRPPLLPEGERAAVIDAMRDVDYVYVTSEGTAWSLRRFRPRYYVKGNDWRGRLPAEEMKVCKELGIEVTYADCPLNSSTRLLVDFMEKSRAHSRV